MTVSTADIPVLHSAEVAHLYPKSCYPFANRSCIPYTSTMEARQGNTMRPLQSSTSFRKPATVLGSSNAGISRLTSIAAKLTQGPPYNDHSPTTWDTTCWDSRFQVPGGSSDSRNLAANRSNTNKHSIGKINITPNISTNCIIMFYALL
jgi:hypothetical protein